MCRVGTRPLSVLRLPFFCRCGRISAGSQRAFGMLLILLFASTALQVWAWRRLRNRVMSGTMTKLGALFQYGAWALTPFLVFIGVLLGAVGAEELTGTAIVPEPFARAVLLMATLLLGIAILGWVGFVILCGLVWRAPGAKA